MEASRWLLLRGSSEPRRVVAKGTPWSRTWTPVGTTPGATHAGSARRPPPWPRSGAQKHSRSRMTTTAGVPRRDVDDVHLEREPHSWGRTEDAETRLRRGLSFDR